MIPMRMNAPDIRVIHASLPSHPQGHGIGIDGPVVELSGELDEALGRLLLAPALWVDAMLDAFT